MQIDGLSHPGRLRPRNEDAIGWDEAKGIAVLADGLGGHPAGEVAARLAVDCVLTHARRDPRPGLWLDSAIAPAQLPLLAHQAIKSHAERDPHSRGMATTLVVACLGERRVAVAHLGDSRAYLLHEGRLQRLTKDHSFTQQAVDQQLMSEEQARHSPVRHQLTQAAGLGEAVQPGLIELPRERDDLLLLCSDGLTGELADPQIELLLNDYEHDLQAAARALVRAAVDAGGHDNVSVVVVRL